ncbi:MAG TPA: phosphate ABC transporter permease subunit PstC [Pedomonas sp.]|uniref:phosphate ABC transporter permease subunit PstC n=1 Tax=Pedomonas sp. TaxID=2976421 RepID=UPI002F429ECD
MPSSALVLLLLGLATIGFLVSRGRAAQFQSDHRSVHSRPNYHGWYSFIWVFLPAALLVVAWSILSPSYIGPAVINSLPADVQPEAGIARDMFLSEVQSLAEGRSEYSFSPGAEQGAALYKEMASRGNWVVAALAGALALLGFFFAFTRVKPDFRARTRVERFMMGLLIFASIVAIMTTLGIVFSLLFESLRFFEKVSPFEFLFGTHWSPQQAIRADQVGSSGAFGAVPLFWGTAFITIIAMTVAVPIGLLSAIYLTQYASPRFRKWMKPILEVLAGVPTVVYGYFAALTVAPLIRQFGYMIGLQDPSSESALAAGLVMGVMIIPFMSSLSDDAITAVPSAMKDGSLALGATPSETIRKVLIPAALPGIVGGFLLAVSRAIGETMIVVMAAGLAANLTANPFESVTTVTTQIVALLTGDQEFDSAKTLSAFALGLVLFIVTLILNVYALRVVKKYREAYE